MKAPCPSHSPPPRCTGSTPPQKSPFAESALLPPPEWGGGPPPTAHLGALAGFGSVQNVWDLESAPVLEIRAFKGTRQLSLQDWCSSPKQGERQAKSLEFSRPVLNQTINLTPHGSPKLTAGGAPLFSPTPPRKAGRGRSIEEVAGREEDRDVLSELLSCDESLGWSWDRGHDAKRSHWSGRPGIPDRHLDL